MMHGLMKKRGKTTVISIAALGVLVLVASTIAFRTEILDLGYRLHWLHGEPGFLGLYAEERSGAVSVREVYHGGPAAKAGVQVDDQVIEVNGVKIGELQDIIRGMQTCYRGRTIPIVVQRGGQTLKLPVTLASSSKVVTEGS